MFSKKATKIDEIFTDDLTLCSKCQIDGEDFAKFCGLLRKHELYNMPHPLAWIELTGYRPLFGISDCWSKFLNPILCGSKWWSASKKLLVAFFDPKQAFFYLLEPLEVPNPDKMLKVNVKTEALPQSFLVK